MKYISLILSIVILVSTCKSRSKNEHDPNNDNQLSIPLSEDESELQQPKVNPKDQEVSFVALNRDSIILEKQDRCEKWFKERKRLDSLKYYYFIDSIYMPALRDPGIPVLNRNILESIKTGLEEKDLSKLFHPIYRLRQNMTSIISFDDYERNLLEEAIRTDSITFSYYRMTNESENIIAVDSTYNIDEHIYYYTRLDSLKKIKNLDQSIIAIGLNGTTSLEIRNVGFMLGDCLEFVTYEIDNSDIPTGINFIFGSTEEIILEFNNNKKLDSLHKITYEETCYDCVYKYEQLVSFARFKGVEDLYFCYADSFPINNKYDYPTRSLTMVMHDTSIAHLWYKNIDLFGCSCL